MRALVPILLASALAGCAPTAPPVAFGGDAAFKARMADRFPPGTPGARVRDELGAAGLAIEGTPDGRRWIAYDVPENLPCYSRTRVDWREDARGRVALLTAQRAECS
jgi:hypothetical protein